MFFNDSQQANRLLSTPRTPKRTTALKITLALLVACYFGLGVYGIAKADTAIPPTPSAWQPTVIGLHIASKHSVPGFNNVNPGVYLRWADAQGNGPAAGVYHNSERATSVWAGYTYSTSRAGPLSAAITLGAITGYQAARVLPLAVPSVALHQGPVAYRLTYVPKVEKRGAHALHLSLEWSF